MSTVASGCSARLRSPPRLPPRFQPHASRSAASSPALSVRPPKDGAGRAADRCTRGMEASTGVAGSRRVLRCPVAPLMLDKTSPADVCANAASACRRTSSSFLLA
eukprot:4503655-Prymnesium_polylepis.1